MGTARDHSRQEQTLPGLERHRALYREKLFHEQPMHDLQYIATRYRWCLAWLHRRPEASTCPPPTQCYSDELFAVPALVAGETVVVELDVAAGHAADLDGAIVLVERAIVA